MVKKLFQKRIDKAPQQPTEIPASVSPARTVWQEALASAPFFLGAILIIACLYIFVFRAYVVDGQSMLPTLQNSDRLIVGKLPITIAKIDGHAYVPKRGDIVIFNQDSLPGYTGTKQLVKRVIGLPGDKIVIKNGQVMIYNSSHLTGFDPDFSGTYKLASSVTIADQEINLKLSPNQIYVLGDNRQNSEDSRYFGPVNLNQIIGKLWLRIWPLSHSQTF